MEIKFDVRDTVKNTEKMKAFLKAEWCKCRLGELLHAPLVHFLILFCTQLVVLANILLRSYL